MKVNNTEAVGQEHLIGEHCLLSKLIHSGFFSNIIFYVTPDMIKQHWQKFMQKRQRQSFSRLTWFHQKFLYYKISNFFTEGYRRKPFDFH